jgi:putative molybdopterin biosynthesis protein
MKVELRLGGLLTIGGREIAVGQTLALLEGVARERSVRGAAERLQLSYRAAWGRLVSLESAVGRAVVVKTKGHGTILTELGEELRSILRASLQKFEAPLAKEQRALEGRLAALMRASPTRLRIAASHDPLLVELLSTRPDVELSVMGSEAALDRLSAGAAEMAGCHFGPAKARSRDSPALLRDRAWLAQPAFMREQGVIVAAGNPLGIRSVADLARTKARFINRQKGSGTRGWLDRMLAEAAISPDQIVGYGIEEFTHQAVAAVVASGAADAALGVRAVAQPFGLGFVPLGWETYYLVTRADRERSELGEIAAQLRLRAGRAIGYRPASTRTCSTAERRAPAAQRSANDQQALAGERSS